MKLSKAALRKVRRKRKQMPVAGVNLVSMIDIFTILIIYLLVNTAAVQIVGADQVDMPKSVAEEPPRQRVAVIVTNDDILVDGTGVMKVADVREKGPDVLDPLLQHLLRVAPITAAQQANAAEEGGEVNILADKTIRYALLKKIMRTCAEAQFAKISLGVSPQGSKE